MPYPIAMTTYERPKYFASTVASLIDSGEDLSLVYIRDDGSTGEEKMRALDASPLAACVRAGENVGTYRSLIRAVCGACEGVEADYVMYCQDDVQFSSGCFTEAAAIADKIKADGLRLGILSLYHRSEKISDAPYQVMDVGHPGAVCWLITRDFWTEFMRGGDTAQTYFKPNDQRVEHFVRHLADYKICRWAQLNGFTVAYTRQSLVQHVGDTSSLSGRDMSFCRVSNFVGVKGEKRA